MLCVQSSNVMVPVFIVLKGVRTMVFIDVVSVVTMRCKNTKVFDTETNNLKFSRAPVFSRTPMIKIAVKQNPTQFQGAE